MDGGTEGQLHVISKKQHETIFEGDYFKDIKMWKIEKTKQHWRPWLKFINDYLFFGPQTETMA